MSKELRINDQIRAREVRVVSDNNEQLGVMSLRSAR
ncbi:MAG: translation initiation factor IF-3, partial [Caecibacter massiliensis]|nr:translation initiation factor IF-3 [Caecibacter massiliensis]